MIEYIYHYKSHEGYLSPIIPVDIKCNNNIVETNAYVDSGATYSVFIKDIAEELGLIMERGNLKYLRIGDGNNIPVFA